MRVKRQNPAATVAAAALGAWLTIFLLVVPAWAQNPAMWPENFAAQQTGVDFPKVARLFPRLKTLVLVSFTHNLGLNDIHRLKSLGAFAQSGGTLGLLGRDWAVLFTRAKNLDRLRRSSLTARVVPLTRFRISGIYRVGFKLVDDEYTGPVNFRVSMPRSGFGKELIRLEVLLSPPRAYTVSKDSAGNSWLELSLAKAQRDSEIMGSFYFVYKVDLAVLLAHALAMVPMDEAPVLPAQSPARGYLLPSAKITSDSPQIIALANGLLDKQKAPRRIYRAILAHIKKNLPYDREKRDLFFGGKMVYRDMSEMYNPPRLTLTAAKAACPSASVLEAALLRAAGVPARTAGRWGHFYTELYMPGWGWLSTSVTPTGIPLVVDADHRHQPFAAWTPPVQVQTTKWSAQVKVLLDSDHE